MVNNAGVNIESLSPAPIHEASEELFDKTVAINTKGVFLGSKHAIAQMVKQEPHPSGDRGWIVNISSIMGLVGLENCRKLLSHEPREEALIIYILHIITFIPFHIPLVFFVTNKGSLILQLVTVPPRPLQLV